MYDFDELVDRVHSNSMKWAYSNRLLNEEQAAANPLPMWVADMDFKVAEPIRQAMSKLIEHGIFGYSGVTDSYKKTVNNWQRTRHNWDVDPNALVLSPGIVTMLNLIIQTYTRPGDSVLIQPPVYVHFHQDVITNGREVVWAPLKLEGDRYCFDAEVFEKAIKSNTRLFILSNPHNPTGNVWSADELKQMGDICAAHGVIVVSDEIHGDLIMDETKRHVPFASLGDQYAQNSIICTAASKTFNLAGLQCSNNYIANKLLREQMLATMKKCGLNHINIMGMVATEAAYRDGAQWLDELLNYIRANQVFFATAINQSGLPIHVMEMDSLYLAWIDCRKMNMSPEELNNFMLTEARLWLDDGRKFGPQGHGFMRINLGCTRKTAEEAVKRLKSTLLR